MCESDRTHCTYPSASAGWAHLRFDPIFASTATDFNERSVSQISQAIRAIKKTTAKTRNKTKKSVFREGFGGANFIHLNGLNARLPPCLHSTDQLCNYSRRPTLLNSNCPVHRTWEKNKRNIETARIWWLKITFGWQYMAPILKRQPF